jgi:hypothetical protein
VGREALDRVVLSALQVILWGMSNEDEMDDAWKRFSSVEDKVAIRGIDGRVFDQYLGALRFDLMMGWVRWMDRAVTSWP